MQEKNEGKIVIYLSISFSHIYLLFSDKNQLFLVGCNIYIYYIFTTRYGRNTKFSCDTYCNSLRPVDKSCSGYNGCCCSSVSNVDSHISVNPGNYIGWSSSYSYPCNYVFMIIDGNFIFSEPEDLKIFATLQAFLWYLIGQGAFQHAENTRFCGEKIRWINTTKTIYNESVE